MAASSCAGGRFVAVGAGYYDPYYWDDDYYYLVRDGDRYGDYVWYDDGWCYHGWDSPYYDYWGDPYYDGWGRWWY